jgi:hypothetical protein
MNQRIEQQRVEKQNQRKALAITLVIQGLLFLLFWYAKIWSAEEMKLELPEPGFEVNYNPIIKRVTFLTMTNPNPLRKKRK